MSKWEEVCRLCGKHYTSEDLQELCEIGAEYFKSEVLFLCPKCFDEFQQMDGEDQLDFLLDLE